MKTITTDKMTIGLVEVPESATELAYYKRRGLLDYRIDFKNSKCVRVPEGCKLISTTKDLTEEVAARIVGVPDRPVKRCVYCSDHGWNNEFMPCDYCNPGGEWKSLGGFSKRLQDYELAIKFSIHNFSGILIANGIDPSKNYAILEIKK